MFFCVNKWMFEWLELFLHSLSRSHVYTVQTLNGMHLSINAVIEMQWNCETFGHGSNTFRKFAFKVKAPRHNVYFEGSPSPFLVCDTIFQGVFFTAGLVSSKYLPEKWEKPQGTTVPFPFFIDNIKSSSIYNPSSKRLGHFKMEIKTKCNDLQIP